MNDPYTRKLQVMLNSARYLLAICVNILVLVLILYGVSRVCICGYHFCYAVFGTVTVDQGKGQEKVFQVETNRSMYEVADKLQKQGLIVDKYSFLCENTTAGAGYCYLAAGNLCIAYEYGLSGDY